MWKNLLNKEYKRFGTSLNIEYNNILKDINPKFSDEMIPFYNLFNEFNNEFQIREDLIGGRVLNYMFIYYFIYWEYFKNSEEIKNYSSCSNPYESLVKLFRYDRIYLWEGINICDITMRDNSTNLILPSIEDDFLNFIDSKCKLFGSEGIPNQIRVDILWNEFINICKKSSRKILKDFNFLNILIL